MLSKCANPKCTVRMKYLHQGRIFLVQSPSAARYWSHDSGSFSAPPGNQIEYFWLCSCCARQMKVTTVGSLECLETQQENFENIPSEIDTWRTKANSSAQLAPTA